MPGIGLNPSQCCCTPCTGTLCVSMTSACTGNGDGYAVVVKDHATAVTVASGTTVSGSVCFTGVPPGNYDATATKTGCSVASWTNQATNCATTTLTAVAKCSSGAGINYTITGCGYPVAGAVIVITGPDSGTITTDSAGKATFFTTATGTFSYSITHPSGRYATLTGTTAKSLVCTSVSPSLTLLPATGYVCCTAATYPVKTTLFLTIGDGVHTVLLAANPATTNAAVSPVLVGTNCSGTSVLDIQITVTCITSVIKVQIGWREISGTGACPISDAYVQYGAAVTGSFGSTRSGTGTPSASPPLLVTGSVAADLPTFTVLGDPTGTTSFTLTE